jgi:hypothetical protein
MPTYKYRYQADQFASLCFEPIPSYSMGDDVRE